MFAKQVGSKLQEQDKRTSSTSGRYLSMHAMPTQHPPHSPAVKFSGRMRCPGLTFVLETTARKQKAMKPSKDGGLLGKGSFSRHHGIMSGRAGHSLDSIPAVVFVTRRVHRSLPQGVGFNELVHGWWEKFQAFKISMLGDAWLFH